MNLLLDKGDRDIVCITGLDEVQDENLPEVVQNFFSNKLGLEEQIPFYHVARVGKGTNRTVLVYLQNYQDKKTIFNHTSKLKDLKNSQERPYFVSSQVSAASKAAADRKRQLR